MYFWRTGLNIWLKSFIDVEIFQRNLKNKWLEDEYLSNLSVNTVIQQGDVMLS